MSTINHMMRPAFTINFTRNKILAAALALMLAGSALGLDLEQEPAIPRHLQLARDFVAHTRQENNAYSNRNIFTRMPGDPLAGEYAVYSDCSGFVEDIFRRAGSGVLEQVPSRKPGRRRLVRDWHPGIAASPAFTRLTRVTDLQPGDVAAWLYADGARHQSAGHILFINSAPVRIAPRPPHVAGLDQYEVSVIDTSQEAKSRDDTRYVSDAGLRDQNEARGKEQGSMASRNYKGVGQGRIRFYADQDGTMRGLAFSFERAKFHANGSDWDIVMGRPRIAP